MDCSTKVDARSADAKRKRKSAKVDPTAAYSKRNRRYISRVDPLLGGAIFLSTSALLTLGGTVAATVYETLHPPRRSVGWALARGFACDPESMGLTARAFTEEIDGSSIDGWQIDVQPTGIDVLLLHGYARSRIDSLRRIHPWLQVARSITLVDLPGHGEARGRGTSLGTHEPRLIAELAQRLDLRNVVLVGHSLGAVVAIRAALEPLMQSRIAGIVAIAPYERLATPIGARLDLRGMPRRFVLNPSLMMLRALGVRETCTSASAANIKVPLAILAGSLDPTSPVVEARLIAARTPHATVYEIEGGRHDDLWIIGTAQYASIAQTFAQLRS